MEEGFRIRPNSEDSFLEEEYTRVSGNPTPKERTLLMKRRIGSRTWIAAGLLGWSLGVGQGSAAGQEGPYAFQVRAGETAPLGRFRAEAEGWEGRAGRGPSLGMAFTFPLYGFVGGLLGFSQHRFGCDENVCPEGKSWVFTGFDIALRSVLGEGNLRPWIQVGLQTPRIEGELTREETSCRNLCRF